jgi:hypothetical protein
VFDRFFRSDAARTMPGSGLGLAIVRQVASDHGGTVLVEEPSDGDGVIVRIELPLSEHADGDVTHEPDDTHVGQHESHGPLETAPDDSEPETSHDGLRVASGPDS